MDRGEKKIRVSVASSQAFAILRLNLNVPFFFPPPAQPWTFQPKSKIMSFYLKHIIIVFIS